MVWLFIQLIPSKGFPSRCNSDCWKKPRWAVVPGNPCDRTSSRPGVDVENAMKKVLSNRIFWKKSSDVSVVSDPHEMINEISVTYRISHKKRCSDSGRSFRCQILVWLGQNLGFSYRFFGLHGIGSASSNGSTTAYLGRVGKSLHHVFYVFQFQWEKVFMNPDCSRVATLGCKVKLLICSSKVIVSLCGSSYFLVVIYTKG